MKKLLIRLILFCIPLLAFLYQVPVEQRDLYAGLDQNCSGHALWIYDRLHANSENADIVFMGSSHTMNGIDDGRLQERLGDGRRVMNLGYCQLGVDLYYHLLKQVLATKRPEWLIIEVRNEENRYRHPVFPYVGGSKDVLTAPIFFNPDFLAENYQHLYYKLEVIHRKIYDELPGRDTVWDDFGWKGGYDTLDTTVLDSIKTAGAHALQSKPGPFLKYIYDRFPNYYLSKIGVLCKVNGIKVVFIYIPGYGEPYRLPTNTPVYKKYGEIWMPPKALFENQNYWFDGGHLNLTGAAALSDWVAIRIKEAGS